MAGKKQLQEKDFIHEEYGQNPYPFWIWLIAVAALVGLIGFISYWYYNTVENKVAHSPFLRVTNRDFSLFLWQNPEFMRVNAKNKTGYLPGFQYTDKVTLDLEQAEDYVIAPPELLFRYHTWNRLLGHVYFSRPISKEEFREFLDYAEEWQPTEWPEAPHRYAGEVKKLEGNLDEILPLKVKQAFQGWKNFFKEGDEINALQITYGQMKELLEKHPHYARNYWRNIVQDKFPNYLKMEGSDDEVIPVDEIAPFLRVAVYNYLKSTQMSRSELR